MSIYGIFTEMWLEMYGELYVQYSMHEAFGQQLPWEATLSSEFLFGDYNYNTHIVFGVLQAFIHVSMGFLGLWRYNTYMVLGWNHQYIQYLDVLKMLVGKKHKYYSQMVVKNGDLPSPKW